MSSASEVVYMVHDFEYCNLGNSASISLDTKMSVWNCSPNTLLCKGSVSRGVYLEHTDEGSLSTLNTFMAFLFFSPMLLVIVPASSTFCNVAKLIVKNNKYSHQLPCFACLSSCLPILEGFPLIFFFLLLDFWFFFL